MEKSTVPQTDALFQLPLEEFTAARNALATELKKAGREEEAGRVKALGRPPVSAWGVNQLYWRHREAFDRLMAAGERFREAQAAQFAGEPTSLRERLTARSGALAELTRHAAATLKEAGHNPTRDLMRRLTLTLEALSAYQSLPEPVLAGRLTADVDPPGFDSLAALVPRGGATAKPAAGDSRVLSFSRQAAERKSGKKEDADAIRRREDAERKAVVDAARAGLREAQRALRSAQKSLAQFEGSLSKASAHVKDEEKAQLAAEQALVKATARTDKARDQARRVAHTAAEAAQAVEDAELAVAKSREYLERLE